MNRRQFIKFILATPLLAVKWPETHHSDKSNEDALTFNGIEWVSSDQYDLERLRAAIADAQSKPLVWRNNLKVRILR